MKSILLSAKLQYTLNLAFAKPILTFAALGNLSALARHIYNIFETFFDFFKNYTTQAF